MSKQMFSAEEHAARLPGWKKWAQEHGVCVPPAFLYNYVPTAAIDRVGDAVASERERNAQRICSLETELEELRASTAELQRQVANGSD